MNLRLDLSDLNAKLPKIISDLKKDVSKEVDRALHTGAILIKSQAVLNAPSYLGNLGRGIDVFEKSTGNTIRYEVISQANYSKAVEFGSKPHTPPLEEIVKWAVFRGMSKEDGARVWHHIRKYGTKPHPFMAPAFAMYKDDVARLVRNAVRGV
jgi:HK97 gp10 family phage protein